MLEFSCPSCDQKMQAAEEHAGRTVTCPTCEMKVKVPAADAPPDGAITVEPSGSDAPAPNAITTPDQARPAKRPRDEDDDDRPYRPRSTASDGAKPVAVGVSVGMVVLIVVGVVFCVLLIIGGILVALLVPALSKVREAAARTQTTNNLKQVVLGAHAYHDMNRRLPTPQWLQQKGGNNSELSWRVAVLPYMEQGQLLNRFDKNSGWNDANNKALLESRPETFEQVLRPEVPKTETTFQYFTGPNTIFPSPLVDKYRLATIPDGSSNTILIAEAQTPVAWSRPADMVYDKTGALPLAPGLIFVAMADGSVRTVDRSKTSDATLRMLIEPDDGQQIGADWN